LDYDITGDWAALLDRRRVASAGVALETIRSVRSGFDLSRIGPLLSGRVIERPTELALET